MRRLLASSFIAASFAFTAPALAGTRNYETTVSAPLTSAVKIEIVVGEDLAHRANNLPKKLSDRGGSNRLNSGFSNNGYYGDKDIKRLTERLQSKIEKKFTKKGIEISNTASTILRVTLTDAKPNRPTFEQLSREPGLSFQSFGNGGAKIESELIAAGGVSLGTMNYKYYETDIRDAARGSGTWMDAYRAFGRYSSKVAKTLQNPVS